MHQLKRYFYWSLCFHACLLLFASLMNMVQHNKKSAFVVFGARSRYDAKTQYAAARITPFVSHQRKRNNSKKNGGKNTNSGADKKNNANTGGKKAATPKGKKGALKKANGPQKKTAAKSKAKKITSKHIPEIGAKKSKKAGAAKTAAIGKRTHKPQNKIKKESTKKKTAPTPPEPIKPAPEDAIPAVEPLEELLNADEPITNDEAGDQSDDTDQGQANEMQADGGFSIEGDYDAQAISQFQYHIQQEIDRVWRPPVGVPKGTLCSIQFLLNKKDGSIESCTFAKRSAVLIYDLSIMRIAKELKFHESLWGKQFKIDFCQ